MAIHHEFQAVVLAAGRGSRMTELTAGKPKCLLPVGSKPLVWYPLMKLQQAGFSDVILIIAENHKADIQLALDKTDLKIKIDYYCVSLKDDLGTADSLLEIYDLIKSDLLILTCDVISDVNLGNIVDLFRKHNATICSLLFSPLANPTIAVPGPKTKQKVEKDLIAIDAQTSRLVFHASASDFETDVALPRALLQKHTNITMYSNLLDAHVYVFKKWILDYMKSNQNQNSFCTIKGELLPYIIRKQLVKKPEPIQPPPTDMHSVIVNVRKDNLEIFTFAQDDQVNALNQDKSAYNDHVGDLSPAYHGDTIRCYAYVAPPDVLGIRVNNLNAYWSINNMIQEKWPKITNSLELQNIDPKATNQCTQISSTFLWDSSKVHEKTSLQNSIIGTNSVVKERSRVINSIVMNNVMINEKVVLENCIVCDNAEIEEDCHLKNCIIGCKYVVPTDRKSVV